MYVYALQARDKWQLDVNIYFGPLRDISVFFGVHALLAAAKIVALAPP